MHTQAELHAAAARVIERYRQPALVEHYLPGREFTVGIVGNGDDARVLGVCEILLKPNAEANVYSLHNKELCEELVTYAPADDGEARLAGTRALASLSGARMPRRGADRFPLRRQGRAVFPRGQSACRPQSLALRPADPRRAERHRLRDADRHDARCRSRPLRAKPAAQAPRRKRA